MRSAELPPKRPAAPQPSEKEFYLRHFRHRSILFHIAAASDCAHVRPVLTELVANQTMVIAVATSARAGGSATLSLGMADLRKLGPGLVELSAKLLRTGAVWVQPKVAKVGLRFSAELALRLGAHKMVVVDARGGLRHGEAVQSFAKVSSLVRVHGRGEPVSGWTAAELTLLRRAIQNGVESINLTSGIGLAAELFSYEGSGTLLTAGEYATVEALRIDDFPQALELLRRGEQEGFLLRRTERERARLLLSGYGAWFESRRLAGIAGLEVDQYRPWRLAEVVGLYTITRFQGEGVGVRMLAELATIARSRGCRAAFACTSNLRAAAFFGRNGFVQVASDIIPDIKWRGRRGARPTVFWCDL